jgi:hypothetical protein
MLRSCSSRVPRESTAATSSKALQAGGLGSVLRALPEWVEGYICAATVIHRPTLFGHFEEISRPRTCGTAQSCEWMIISCQLTLAGGVPNWLVSGRN